MNAVNLAVVQFTPTFGRKLDNFHRLGGPIADLEADLIVCPELCTTGYFFTARDDLEQAAEKAEGPTFEFMRNLSERLDAVIAAGFAEKENVISDHRPQYCQPLTAPRQKVPG